MQSVSLHFHVGIIIIRVLLLNKPHVHRQSSNRHQKTAKRFNHLEFQLPRVNSPRRDRSMILSAEFRGSKFKGTRRDYVLTTRSEDLTAARLAGVSTPLTRCFFLLSRSASQIVDCATTAPEIRRVARGMQVLRPFECSRRKTPLKSPVLSGYLGYRERSGEVHLPGVHKRAATTRTDAAARHTFRGNSAGVLTKVTV